MFADRLDQVLYKKEGGVINCSTRGKIIDIVSSSLQDTACVLHAMVYGSWLFNEQSVDMDIAVVVNSKFGVVNSEDYSTLRELRSYLCKETGQDIDLVPHTEDEFTDHNSPLWYPRYNPSLVFGKNLKGNFQISPISTSFDSFSFEDLTAYVLHDNRTICRRQLVRSFHGEEGRIFISKLLHGPGNALTYNACKNRSNYSVSPSDIEGCFDAFDKLYGVDSLPIMVFLRQCKNYFDQEKAYLLMNWYEHLIKIVLLGVQFREDYNHICSFIEIKA